MALSKASPSEIPKDAILISENQALNYQWKIISNWEKENEVWALRYTPGILGSLATGSGILINNHFRAKLKLGNYGRFSTYLPIVVIPALLTLMFHKTVVQRSILLEPMKTCPTCLQLKATALQVAFGVIYPTFLAPISASFFATRHFTYRLPFITEKPLEVLQLIRKFTKPLVPTLGCLLIAQSLVATYLTYKEQDQNYKVLVKLRNVEQKVEQELGL